MARYVALLRGINVGPTTAVPMATLAAIVADLGYTDVTTVLRSGNVVFSATSGPLVETAVAASIQDRVTAATGVRADTIVLGASRFLDIVAANPLRQFAESGSGLVTTFLSMPAPDGIEAPDAATLLPERLHVCPSAVYQWFPLGSQQTRVRPSFWTQFGGVVTARNENTVQRLANLLLADVSGS